MPDVRIDDPPTMNVLGLFLASALRRNLVAEERPCSLRGGLTVEADGMRATVFFDADGATVTRKEGAERVRISGSLPQLLDALVRPGLGTLLRVKVRGNRLFALRAMRLLAS
ncbi:MAG: hypothetical protein ACYTEZ_03720 [Planctomycetota bacterium]